MKELIVSIIVPLFNRASLIREMLNSVKAQTYPYWELIVIDDGSTDEGQDIIKAYLKTDNRIKLFQRSRKPKGAPTCRNIGIEKSRGDYLVFLDSDDLLAEFCLERRVRYMERNPHFDFVAFPMLIFNREKFDLGILTNVDTFELPLYRYLRGDNLWQTTQPIWKRSSILKLNGFDEVLSCSQEADLHIRALLASLKYESKLSLEPDCYCRHHSGESISKNKNFYYAASRERFIRKIAKEINIKTYPDAHRNFKALVIDVVMDLSYAGAFENAKSLEKQAREEGILSLKDSLLARGLMLAYFIKLHHIRGFYRLRSLCIKSYFSKNFFMKTSWP